ncbi:MAG: NTP transferase domain-containing protein [Lachnospiraceae bacterium]|nr:NTP transferase domain-containing protein [Lachnospiraceae bacterium]
MIEAMITAAGLSSRMGRDKALLEAGGVKNLTRQLNTFAAAGVDFSVVITGHHRKERMAAAAKSEMADVREVYNPRFAETQMFDSIRLGLQDYLQRNPQAGEEDGLFFVPTDEPFFSLYSVKRLLEEFKTGKGKVYTASFQGKPGHPLLIRSSAIRDILAHDGTRGLRGALERFGDGFVFVPVPDPGVGMDADTPQEWERILREAEERQYPGDERCRFLLNWFQSDPFRREHCEAVAKTAFCLAEQLRKQKPLLSPAEQEALGWSNGFLDAPEDSDLVKAAAWLHDIAKGEADHAVTGARWLDELGYTRIAPWVGAHTDLPEEYANGINGAMLVYLADKRVKGDCPCTLEERFAGGRMSFPANSAAREALERRYAAAVRAQQMIRSAGIEF